MAESKIENDKNISFCNNCIEVVDYFVRSTSHNENFEKKLKDKLQAKKSKSLHNIHLNTSLLFLVVQNERSQELEKENNNLRKQIQQLYSRLAQYDESQQHLQQQIHQLKSKYEQNDSNPINPIENSRLDECIIKTSSFSNESTTVSKEKAIVQKRNVKKDLSNESNSHKKTKISRDSKKAKNILKNNLEKERTGT
jgi:hypothetical protein